MLNIWVEKYRPKTMEELILPDKIKKTLNSLGNYLFVSTIPGLGKTSLTKILIKDCDVLWLNASENNDVSTIRGKIVDFCETVSLSKRKKVVVLDEADNLSVSRDGTAGAQDILRGVIEKYTKVNFILTANILERFIEPLKNRFQIIDFDKIYQENKKELAIKILSFCKNILEKENIKYDENELKKLIKIYYPSVRKIVNTLQLNSKTGVFKLENEFSDVYKEILKNVLKGNFNETYKIVDETLNLEYLFTYFWKKINVFKNPPKVIITMAKYQEMFKNSLNRKVTMMAFLTELMNLEKE